MRKSCAVLRLWVMTTALVIAFPVAAQEESAPKIDVSFNVRSEFTYEKPKDAESTAGFHGSYLNLMIKGELTPQLSYSFRQRMNKYVESSNDVFAATDWVYLTYKPTENWAISGGKQIYAVGGYEYDAAPIDIYYSSLYWHNIACYQFGVSTTYFSNDGNHSLMFQFCNSPYAAMGEKHFAYNLLWGGNMGKWHTLWSLNVMDCGDNTYGGYLMLGNRLNLGALTLKLDLMSRQYAHCDFFDNFSIIAKAEYQVNAKTNFFAKGGYEHFKGDRVTTVECKKPFGSAGIETRPIKNYPGLRLHAVYGLTSYTGELQHNGMVGMTLNCNILKK